jgi:phosphoribosylanthranilate isomerase
MRTRVKICGITRRQDAEIAIENGADALGFVFYAPSPRAVTIEQAQPLVAQLPAFVTKVALFVDETPEQIRQCLSLLAIDLLQFHGDETAVFCEQFNKPYIKAIRMRDDTDLAEIAKQYASASALLLDSFQPGVPGGTGLAFDWSLISHINKPIILAGGLTPDNVQMAIQQVSPYAVDVSGGVESAKGIKDKEKISAFMREVANA